MGEYLRESAPSRDDPTIRSHDVKTGHRGLARQPWSHLGLLRMIASGHVDPADPLSPATTPVEADLPGA